MNPQQYDSLKPASAANHLLLFAVAAAIFAVLIAVPIKMFGAIALMSLLIAFISRISISRLYKPPPNYFFDDVGKGMTIEFSSYHGPNKSIAVLMMLYKVSAAALIGVILAGVYLRGSPH